MSSWEKWVFPQEVNAFPSPSFSLALPHVAHNLPPPQTFHSVLFFPLFLTSSTLKYSTQQCSSQKLLGHLCESQWSIGRKMMMEEDRECIDAVFTSICLTLNPYGWLFDYWQLCCPAPEIQQRLNLHGLEDRKWYTDAPSQNFCFLISIPYATLLWFNA